MGGRAARVRQAWRSDRQERTCRATQSCAVDVGVGEEERAERRQRAAIGAQRKRRVPGRSRIRRRERRVVQCHGGARGSTKEVVHAAEDHADAEKRAAGA
jgi:hypothetical protein